MEERERERERERGGEREEREVNQSYHNHTTNYTVLVRLIKLITSVSTEWPAMSSLIAAVRESDKVPQHSFV